MMKSTIFLATQSATPRYRPATTTKPMTTAVVIGFVVVAGLYLGVADWVAKKIVDYII